MAMHLPKRIFIKKEKRKNSPSADIEVQDTEKKQQRKKLMAKYPKI